MATASPTPMGTAGTGLSRRPSQRQGLRRLPSRPHLNRSESNPVHATSAAPALSKKADSQQYTMHDSSDDEIPVPMKLSALTKALLNDGGAVQSERAPSPPRTRRRASNLATSHPSHPSHGSGTEERRSLRSGSVHAHDTRSSRQSSPVRSRENSPVRKRVVRLSNTPKSLGQMGPTKRRSTSLSRSTTQRPRSRSRPESRDQSSDEKQEPPQDINTPAQGVRVVRIAAGSSGNRSRLNSSSGHSRRSGSHLEQEYSEEPATSGRHAAGINPGSVSRHTSNVGRNTKPEDNLALQSSMRVKRVGKVPGSFLSGPARRGRRRQSEEEAEANGEGDGLMSSQEHDGQAPDMDNDLASSFYGNGRQLASGSPVALSDPSRASHRRPVSYAEPAPARHSPHEREEPEEIHYRLPAPRPQVPSTHDQENEAPSILRSSKPAANLLADKEAEKVPKRPLGTDAAPHRPASPERKPLSSLAHNTPRRPAPPPPPKMSVLDAATTSAGAATTSQGKQRRNILRVNGKSYTRLDCLGRGGSAKVYRVTAENGAMFALKRVSLENADETTIRGYRGEIDLLGKLTGVDRVINLFDYEMNDEKRMLTLLMEMGELDLNTLLRSRQNPEAAKFDPVFVRFYWKEMLECLQSVHQFDIVHSDLKPANFVLVKGRLKLIDFGIANAIQTDETVNVHRETQIGTPNYMSPESLLDFNAPRGGRVPGRPKLMKLGKPSDVWSLGCILYQLVYGIPPFGHIANQMARCQAIINWDHNIEFPARGMGGVPVPPSLLRTLKRCLNREVHMRPTCEELLHETDPFLYPNELSEKALPIDEELLGRIIQSVVTRCRERMPTEAEAMSVWPSAYWASVKKATNSSRS